MVIRKFLQRRAAVTQISKVSVSNGLLCIALRRPYAQDATMRKSISCIDHQSGVVRFATK